MRPIHATAQHSSLTASVEEEVERAISWQPLKYAMYLSMVAKAAGWYLYETCLETGRPSAFDGSVGLLVIGPFFPKAKVSKSAFSTIERLSGLNS